MSNPTIKRILLIDLENCARSLIKYQNAKRCKNEYIDICKNVNNPDIALAFSHNKKVNSQIIDKLSKANIDLNIAYDIDETTNNPAKDAADNLMIKKGHQLINDLLLKVDIVEVKVLSSDKILIQQLTSGYINHAKVYWKIYWQPNQTSCNLITDLYNMNNLNNKIITNIDFIRWSIWEDCYGEFGDGTLLSASILLPPDYDTFKIKK